MPSPFDQWLSELRIHDDLRVHVQSVMTALPGQVSRGLIDDPSFVVFDYDPTSGRTHTILIAPPRAKKPGRSVVLKQTLRHRPPAFVRWVIAHELAHAHLHNRGRHEAEDAEVAADALAAEWGFPKPS